MKILSLILLVMAILFYWLDVATHLELLVDYNRNLANYSLVIACICYGLLLMLPFFPALEAGLLIMAMYGVDGVVGAYITTVVSLLLSFLLGYILMKNNHLAWVKNIARKNLKANPNKRLNKIMVKVLNTLNVRPYFSLALLLNMPGNSLLGGGGGIAMMAGASGAVQFYKYSLTVLVATSIIPVLILFGMAT